MNPLHEIHSIDYQSLFYVSFAFIMPSVCISVKHFVLSSSANGRVSCFRRSICNALDEKKFFTCFYNVICFFKRSTRIWYKTCETMLKWKTILDFSLLLLLHSIHNMHHPLFIVHFPWLCSKRIVQKFSCHCEKHFPWNNKRAKWFNPQFSCKV